MKQLYLLHKLNIVFDYFILLNKFKNSLLSFKSTIGSWWILLKYKITIIF